MAYLRLDRRRGCLLPDQAPPDAVVLVQGRDERRAACVSETNVYEAKTRNGKGTGHWAHIMSHYPCHSLRLITVPFS